jgi:hypothetical protein
MSRDLIIVTQLAKIRTLESHLAEALHTGAAKNSSQLDRQMRELKKRVDLLDRTLSQQAA